MVKEKIEVWYVPAVLHCQRTIDMRYVLVLEGRSFLFLFCYGWEVFKNDEHWKIFGPSWESIAVIWIWQGDGGHPPVVSQHWITEVSGWWSPWSFSDKKKQTFKCFRGVAVAQVLYWLFSIEFVRTTLCPLEGLCSMLQHLRKIYMTQCKTGLCDVPVLVSLIEFLGEMLGALEGLWSVLLPST